MINIVMFSAGVNLVKYHCVDCHHDHQQLLLPVSHLNHDHSGGYCHIDKSTHCDSEHADHDLLKIDDIPVLKKQDIKINIPVKKWLGHTNCSDKPATTYRHILHGFTPTLDSPGILAITSVLRL